MKKKSNFDANLTAGGLLYAEFDRILHLIDKIDFLEEMKNESKENNSIGIDIEASRKRIISEMVRRYHQAPQGFWEHYIHWNEWERKLALYYLCLKTYPLLYDIHFEVVQKKYKLGLTLNDYDIQMRFDELASLDSDFGNWAEITLYKLNSQIRTILKDSGIYDGQNLKKPNAVGLDFQHYFKKNNEPWFLDAVFI